MIIFQFEEILIVETTLTERTIVVGILPAHLSFR